MHALSKLYLVILFLICAEGVLIGTSSEASEPPTAKPPPSIAIAPAPHAASPKIEHIPTFFGTVRNVCDNTITISGTSKRNGKLSIRTYTFGAHLQNGEQDPSEATSRDYRISDVKGGDTVSVRLHEEGDKDICVSIQIFERPGGTVPPAPWDETDPRFHRPEHEAANAYQAFKEKGIPLPPDLDPVVRKLLEQAQADATVQRRKKRARQLWIENHTAPMPRAVKRRR